MESCKRNLVNWMGACKGRSGSIWLEWSIAKPGMRKQKIWKPRCRRFWGLLPAAAVLTTLGCTSIGPDSVPRDRFDYASAIRDSWKHELLQNIVNMRYGGIPVFIDVASVISQYELQGSLSANAAANASIAGEDVYGIGGNAKYTERPTITYLSLIHI